MKCPECDSEQPDNASLCAKCGLSFERWHEANPETAKAASAPEPEMTFPVPDEDKPVPKDKDETTPEVPSPKEAESSSESETVESPQAGAIEEQALGGKKSFKWTPLY